MEKFLSYFLLKDLDKDIALVSKERILIIFIIMMLLSVSILSIPIYYYLEIRVLTKFIYFIILALIFLLFFYKLSKKLRVTSFLFIIAYFIYFFFNIIYTGGIVSPLIIWLILLPILAITLNNNLI